jgi:hypothetical protein
MKNLKDKKPEVIHRIVQTFTPVKPYVPSCLKILAIQYRPGPGYTPSAA